MPTNSALRKFLVSGFRLNVYVSRAGPPLRF